MRARVKLGGWVLGAALLLTGPAAWAQAPAWQTAVPTGGSREVTATAADASGNVYLVGSFYGTLNLGSTTLVSAGSSDVFVAKWNAATGFGWAVRAGGIGNDDAMGVAVSGSSVYVTGYFYAPASDPATFGSIQLASAGTDDAFIAKLTDAGSTASFGWARACGGPGFNVANSIAVVGSSVYVTGSVEGTATFGSITLPGTGSGDGFVAKLTDAGLSGNFVWVQCLGGSGLDFALGVAVRGPSVYMTGVFNGTAAFGSLSLVSAGAGDGFVAKLTDAGSTSSFGWVQRIGGAGRDGVYGVALGSSAVYVSGAFSGTAAFGSTSLVSAGAGDGFVAKLTDAGSSGSFGWVVPVSSLADDFAGPLAVRGNSVYTAGEFGGPTVSIGGISMPSAGASDVFVTRLVDAGPTASVAWAQRAGGPNADTANGLALAGARVVVGGSSNNPAQFGTIVLASSGSPFATGFLASLTDPTLAAVAALPGLPIGLWPNPARATTTVYVPATAGTTETTLTLHDALGRTVGRHTAPLPATGLRHALDLSGLPPGLYALRVQAGAATATRRLVVE